MHPLIAHLKGKLIVSVQAYPGEPMRHPETMAQIARAAEIGGAAAIRCQGLSDISAIKGRVDVPVIGLWKEGHEGVYITPSLRHARACVMAGSDIVALDATGRPRLDGLSFAETVAALREDGTLVMADCGSFEDAQRAVDAGVDIVSTTLAGYTGDRVQDRRPRPGAAARGRRRVPGRPRDLRGPRSHARASRRRHPRRVPSPSSSAPRSHTLRPSRRGSRRLWKADLLSLRHCARAGDEHPPARSFIRCDVSVYYPACLFPTPALTLPFVPPVSSAHASVLAPPPGSHVCLTCATPSA